MSLNELHMDSNSVNNYDMLLDAVKSDKLHPSGIGLALVIVLFEIMVVVIWEFLS